MYTTRNANENKNYKNSTNFLGKKNSSLYIGDLSTKVREDDILNIFSKMSGLESVRICRDVISKESLGYGYINFKKTKFKKTNITK